MQSFRLRFTAYNKKILNEYFKVLKAELDSEGYKYTTISLPTKSKLFTLIKSPFVNKKSREQFKIEESSKLVLLEGSTFLEIYKVLRKSPLEGIALKIALKGR